MSEFSVFNCPDVLYTIRDVETGKVIWNARGGCYKNREDVIKKLKKLHKQRPDKHYRVICWMRSPLEGSVEVWE